MSDPKNPLYWGIPGESDVAWAWRYLAYQMDRLRYEVERIDHLLAALRGTTEEPQ